jgi:8-oxo-dGTP pyrophosphatase MutT (NUDIX family)
VTDQLAALLQDYRPADADEARDRDRVIELVRAAADPWARGTPLHLTASALIIHPDSGRILLRWHERQQAWLQVGGHADPGERDPFAVALREAREETGLTDLRPWPDAALRHLVIVPVAAGRGEPEHEHADLRFLLATGQPDAASPELPGAALRWLPAETAGEATSVQNLRVTLARARRLLDAGLPG